MCSKSSKARKWLKVSEQRSSHLNDIRFYRLEASFMWMQSASQCRFIEIHQESSVLLVSWMEIFVGNLIKKFHYRSDTWSNAGFSFEFVPTKRSRCSLAFLHCQMTVIFLRSDLYLNPKKKRQEVWRWWNKNGRPFRKLILLQTKCGTAQWHKIRCDKKMSSHKFDGIFRSSSNYTWHLYVTGCEMSLARMLRISLPNLLVKKKMKSNQFAFKLSISIGLPSWVWIVGYWKEFKLQVQWFQSHLD